jgi:DM4/DM12 family
MSFNFEANYALPTKSTDFTQGLYDKILFLDGVPNEEAVTENRDSDFLARELPDSNALISRRHVYDMIERKIETYGLSGRECLLRMICEGAGVNVDETNGVVGSLMHILLS